MSKVQVIEGEIFTDYRGLISSLNDFDFEGVERFYFIHHPDADVVRGWRCSSIREKMVLLREGGIHDRVGEN